MGFSKGLFGTCAALFLSGCAAVNAPINDPLNPSELSLERAFAGTDVADEEMFIGLAFSGGGHRASAFSYGMLKALQEVGGGEVGLLDHVRLVTGVSGGSVTAAYYGLEGPAGLDRFRTDYLLQNAEKYMSTSVFNPVTLVRGVSGGANSRQTFARFLDEAIFEEATFADLWQAGHATTWINAADVANTTPFLFSQETFDALCSNLANLPVSEAVAASAAFPLVFSPVVLESHQDACNYVEPIWLASARNNPEASRVIRSYAHALDSYRDPEKVKYVKLLDGGITDNFGTTALALEREKSDQPFAPLSARQAVNVKRMMFLVANAATQSDYAWTRRVKGPGGVGLGMSIANTAMASATRNGYDVLRLEVQDFADELVEWRCGLSRAQVRSLRGSTRGWDCRDFKLFLGQVEFNVLDEATRARLNDVPTRLKLPREQVEDVIAAGIEATRLNPEFRGFLRSIGAEVPAEGGRRITAEARRITPSN